MLPRPLRCEWPDDRNDQGGFRKIRYAIAPALPFGTAQIAPVTRRRLPRDRLLPASRNSTASVNLTRDTALTEAGAQVATTRHDILTGSNPDGTGGGQGDSWNSAPLSRGCSQAALRASLGDGLLYCFAAD